LSIIAAGVLFSLWKTRAATTDEAASHGLTASLPDPIGKRPSTRPAGDD
jgi:tellurite resistance protein TerC